MLTMDIDNDTIDDKNAIKSSLTKIVEKLVTEKYILQKLIYRNHNQHKKTKLFRSFIKLNKALKKITSERLTALNVYTDKCIRLSKKATARDLSDVLSCMKDLYNIVIMTLDICLLCNTSANIISRQLKQHLFIPLYSVFLAISARLLKIMSSLVLHFHNLLSCLITQMKHIRLIQSRFAISIDKALKETAFSSNQLDTISSLKETTNSIINSSNSSRSNIRINDASSVVLTNEEFSSEDVGEYISNSVSMDVHIPCKNSTTDEYSEEPLGEDIFSERTDDSLISKRKFSSPNNTNTKKVKYNN